jgi:hypothetical protein
MKFVATKTLEFGDPMRSGLLCQRVRDTTSNESGLTYARCYALFTLWALPVRTTLARLI